MDNLKLDTAEFSREFSTLFMAIYETEDKRDILQSRQDNSLRSYFTFHQRLTGMIEFEQPIPLYEHNAACVSQMHGGFCKNPGTKHINYQYFYPSDLVKENKLP